MLEEGFGPSRNPTPDRPYNSGFRTRSWRRSEGQQPPNGDSISQIKSHEDHYRAPAHHNHPAASVILTAGTCPVALGLNQAVELTGG